MYTPPNSLQNTVILKIRLFFVTEFIGCACKLVSYTVFLIMSELRWSFA